MHAMSSYVRAATLDQIPPGKGRVVFAKGKPVALFNVAGELYALEDACPHAGSSLGTGKLDGAIVQCRAHGLRFDVRTGAMQGNAGLRCVSIPVRVTGDEIAVCLDRGERAGEATNADAQGCAGCSNRSSGNPNV
jgi:3-phenylpropionate/trans-cinnamate dioxygenase ferredoxin subunit